MRKIDFGPWLTLTKMNLTLLTLPCESRRMIAREKTIRHCAARRKRAGVIVFPAFEAYGDQIADCLSTLGEQEPARAAVRKVTVSLRGALANLERVRNSTRHMNMACLMRHTLEALRASEWEGARYLLMTGSALLHARAIRPGLSLNGPDTGGTVFQLPPMPTDDADELMTVEATSGMVTG